MCVEWRGEWFEAESDIIAYKQVVLLKDDDCNIVGGRSYWMPEERIRQDHKTAGTLIVYKPGETVASDEPGIYMYTEVPKAAYYLKMRIPAGTMVRYGKMRGSYCFDTRTYRIIETINALTADVIEWGNVGLVQYSMWTAPVT